MVASTLQSEQGTRFLGKRNRNSALLVEEEVLHGKHHRWVRARDLCALVFEPHLLNTDARSALVCAPWDLLTGGGAFPGDGFARELRASYELPDEGAWQPLAALREALERPADWREEPAEVSLDGLDGWHVAEEGPTPYAGGPYSLRHIHVSARSREVPEWDQPIIQSRDRGRVILPLGRWRGAVHFLFRMACEPGFGSRRELTPALTAAPGEDASADGPFITELLANGRGIASCLQSEEGGRFLQDENLYSLLDVGEASPPPPEFHWVSLAQIRSLLARGESLTNESRSAISLLLRWL